MIKNMIIVALAVITITFGVCYVQDDRELFQLKAQQDSLANVVINLRQHVTTCQYEKDSEEAQLNKDSSYLLVSTKVLNQQTAAIKALKQQRTEDHALMIQAANQLLSCAYKLQQ